MAKKGKPPVGKCIEALRHEEAKRRNIPTAEYQSVIQNEAEQPLRVAYERRNRDLDPQLVWRGKDQQDWSDLVVQAPPIYIQEKVLPKVLIDDLLRQTRERRQEAGEVIPDLFADFNGLPEGVDKTDFYQHDQNWSNRMILGDSLQVMASLAEREGLRGKVQCIYIESVPTGALIYRHDNVYSQGRASAAQPYEFQGIPFDPWPKNSHWKCQYPDGVRRLERANRLALPTPNSISYVRFLRDFSVQTIANVWLDTQTGAFTDDKVYVVQTNTKVIERCVLMSTDPGDLVLDPTCGAGTTAIVAEQWGRRWITIDTSRVALALARARIMGARYPYYLLADSREGQLKDAEVSRTAPSSQPTFGRIRQGFVYERVPHITSSRSPTTPRST